MSTPATVTVDSTSAAAGQLVALTDADGAVVASWVQPEGASAVVLAAGLVSGDSYTVYTGDSTSSVTSTDTVDGLTAGVTVTAADAAAAGGGMGGRGGGGGGPHGGGPGDGNGFSGTDDSTTNS